MRPMIALILVSCCFAGASSAIAGECEPMKLLPSPTGPTPRSFGRSVALDGDVLIVGGESGSCYQEARIFRWSDGGWVLEQVLNASDGSDGAVGFGGSVAVSGDVAVVGAYWDEGGRGSAYVYRYDAAALSWVEEAKLTASDGAEEDCFGSALSVRGGVAFVGACLDDDRGSDSGSVYVYRHDETASTWVEESKITPTDGDAGDRFGGSVALSGDRAVVGAYWDDGGRGSAYVYRHDAAALSWVEEAKLAASDGESLDQFGGSVAVDGGVVVIGAPWDWVLSGYDPPRPIPLGAAYVYRHDLATSTWAEEQKLAASDPAPAEYFGASVSVSGDVAVVGAPFQGWGRSSSTTGSAYAYRYDRTTATWVEERELTAPDGAPGNGFGFSVSLSGEAVVVGVPGDDDPVPDAGAAYLYRHDPTTSRWMKEQKLTSSDGAGGEFFGGAVAVSGDVAAVGAPGNDDFGELSGAAYLYRLDLETGRWRKDRKILASDGTAGDRFGESVSVSGDVAVVGAWADDAVGDDAGSAYVYRHDRTTLEWVEEQKLFASDGAYGDRFARSVAVSGDVAIVGATGCGVPGGCSGAAYVYRYDGSTLTWEEEQKLTAPDGAHGDRFGASVSVCGDLALVGATGDGRRGADSGSAYVYRYDRTTLTWVLEQKLIASDGAEGDTFGHATALAGNVAVIGAPGTDGVGKLSGSAHVYRFDATSGAWLEEQKLIASDGSELGRFGHAVALRGVIIVGAPGVAGVMYQDPGAAYVYRYDGAALAWVEERRLEAADGAPRDGFGASVSTSGNAAWVGAPGDDAGCSPGCSAGAAHVYDLAACLPPPYFVRGDSDSNGVLEPLADILHLLSFGFLGGPPPLCPEAADADGDGVLNALADAVYVLAHGFSGGPPPPPPYPGCDPDPDPTASLGCDATACP